MPKAEPTTRRATAFRDMVKMNMWFEREHVAWLDELKAKYGISRQAVVHGLNDAIIALELERPGMITHLLRNYAKVNVKEKVV